MSQNAMRLQWTTEEVDNKLKASSVVLSCKFCLSNSQEQHGVQSITASWIDKRC